MLVLHMNLNSRLIIRRDIWIFHSKVFSSGHFFKIYGIFLTKNNFQIFRFICFAYFYSKTWWTIQKWGNFYNLSFFQKFRVDPDPRHFFIQIQLWRIYITALDKIEWLLKYFKLLFFYYFSLNLMLLLRTKNVKMQFQVGKISFSGKWWIGLIKFWTVFHF